MQNKELHTPGVQNKELHTPGVQDIRFEKDIRSGSGPPDRRRREVAPGGVHRRGRLPVRKYAGVGLGSGIIAVGREALRRVPNPPRSAGRSTQGRLRTRRP
ncbi:hypothetical protein acdb102_41430 [Acidothermaceae bacterium B102]|nr:hypothetical protein acdb102_41430 [Acidothermaceae bacterium B102]